MLVKALRLLFILLPVLIFQNAFAQNSTQSPYSRYGLGEINFSGFGKSYSMGQISQGLRSRTNINILNPASYSVIDSTTFETAVIARLGQMKTDTKTQDFNAVSYGYLGLAFPIMAKRSWGAAIGLTPYTLVGYNNSNRVDSSFGSYTQSFHGIGGLSRFFLGTGFQLFSSSDSVMRPVSGADSAALIMAGITRMKRLAKNKHRMSFGANGSYIFGQINKIKQQEFPNDSNYSYVDSRNQYISNPGFDLGLQYSIDFGGQRGPKLDLRKRLVIGVSYLPAISLNLDQTFFARTVKYTLITTTNTIAAVVKDTITYETGIKNKVKVPHGFRGGLALEKGKWLIGADYSTQLWSGFAMPGSEPLSNSYQVSLGAQFIPRANDIFTRQKKQPFFPKYFRSIQYRAGLRYGNTNLKLEDQIIKEYGASLGFALPIGPTSKLNLTLDYTVRGTTEFNLIREEFFRIIVGVTLNDKWFNRSKID